MKKVLLINGVNLNMLGIREPEIYGTLTLAEIEKRVVEHGKNIGIEVDTFSSNYEGAIVEAIHKTYQTYDGIVINPAAHTHYSYALHDALTSVKVPAVEVHLSDINSREGFRKISVVAPACIAQISGRGIDGYFAALDLLKEYEK